MQSTLTKNENKTIKHHEFHKQKNTTNILDGHL